MLGEASYEETQQAMEGSRRAGDERLVVQFFMRPRKNGKKSKEAGRPIFEDREYVRIMVPGNKDSIVCRPVSDMERNRFARQYRDWQDRRNDAEQSEGTPLSEWPGITRSQCEELAYFKVYTVEQLAGLSDTNAQGMMGIALLREKAKAYLEASETEAAAEEINALRQQNAQLAKTLEQMNARLAMLEDDGGIDDEDAPAKPAPKKSGRRRSASAAA
jgi:hypothetical protein